MKNQDSQKNKNHNVLRNILALIMLAIVILAIGITSGYIYANRTEDGRTIVTTGSSTIKTDPDEYVLFPNISEKAATSKEATEKVSSKLNTLLAEVESLGVNKNQIATSVYSSETYNNSCIEIANCSIVPESEKYTGYASIQINIPSLELTEKVVAKLQSLEGIDGQLSPQASLSEAKRKEIQAQAKEKAVIEAKEKASKEAGYLDQKVGTVLKIEDSLSDGYPYPIYNDSKSSLESTNSSSSTAIPIRGGQIEVTSQITVTFRLK
jgi:uncharacterized protein YggE